MIIEQPKKVGADLDGVIVDYVPFLLEGWNKIEGTNYTMEDLWKTGEPDLRAGQSEISKIVNEHIKKRIFRKPDPIKGALDGIKQLREKGHTIHFLTHRWRESKEDAVWWLEKYGVKYESISFGNEKGEMGALLGVDWIIDDHESSIENAMVYGIKSIIFPTPWNGDYDPENNLTQRAKGTPEQGYWKSVVEIING